MKANLPIRQQDKFGSGEYDAPRGKRKHRGIDISCFPGTEIYPDISGTVTKIGYPYGDDLSFRYVQVTDYASPGPRHWRYFYLDPLVKVGDVVDENDIIGTVQDLDKRYPGITPHCHLEIKQYGVYINPDKVI